ncbi:MAG: hypothetical protein MN733_18700, partial [Nitrososphaera sp.]|nr:hypothetical protein [Nitrososphaera sp.]
MKTIKRIRYVAEDGFEYRFEPIPDTLTATPTKSGFEARYLTLDNDPMSPDENGDDGLFLVHYHRHFDVRRDNIVTENDVRQWYNAEPILQEADYHIFPVAAYIHSGVVLSLGEGRQFPDYQWDVSHVGALFASKKEWPDATKAYVAAESLIN